MCQELCAPRGDHELDTNSVLIPSPSEQCEQIRPNVFPWATCLRQSGRGHRREGEVHRGAKWLSRLETGGSSVRKRGLVFRSVLEHRDHVLEMGTFLAHLVDQGAPALSAAQTDSRAEKS